MSWAALTLNRLACLRLKKMPEMSTYTAPMPMSLSASTLQPASSILLFISQMATCSITKKWKFFQYQNNLVLHLLGISWSPMITHSAELPNSEVQFFPQMSFFLMPCSTLVPQKGQQSLQPLRDASAFSRALRWCITHFITLSLLAYSQEGWFFFYKHLPSSNSGSWARLVATMWRKDLITPNTNPDCYRESCRFLFSKIKTRILATTDST